MNGWGGDFPDFPPAPFPEPRLAPEPDPWEIFASAGDADAPRAAARGGDAAGGVRRARLRAALDRRLSASQEPLCLFRFRGAAGVFFADYIAMIALFTAAGYYLAKALVKI